LVLRARLALLVLDKLAFLFSAHLDCLRDYLASTQMRTLGCRTDLTSCSS